MNSRLLGIAHRLEHLGPFEARLRRPGRAVRVLAVDGDRVEVEVIGVPSTGDGNPVSCRVRPSQLTGLPPRPALPRSDTVGNWILGRLREAGKQNTRELMKAYEAEHGAGTGCRILGALPRLCLWIGRTKPPVREGERVRVRPAGGGRSRWYYTWEVSP